MSTRDTRYYRECVICHQRLVGTDDGLQVFESLKDQVCAIENGTADFDSDPCCDLCGEECPLAEAKTIISKGSPTLHQV